ncbi:MULTISPECIES: precorrin-6y C5,15-methyltransferase (decarboxylating) subunit CbiE [unclassified Rhodococcus (in: high G+C Gram-positive bacteria)]|uniref:precorrin-6y C5,15-methyltransferase (decarboxylating) subunit CbiE n=1 Tax=unclassified Rhodococcus (in: high G+C Gram-positive bacteria) TaxID=192944 RepID=UPI0025510096|nr:MULTISPECIES: precorrin-6y C5,15-methyltransferase (decarboxylating) subunit CbiE [unclassified Rhodococcus (in: high G+C Gram-positive bacteria)]MDQ1201774.1 precorrin-6Y C5,15-methyltransferase (decarboxylating) [Rhodococcus sp. SORGH_AS_0303]
MIDVVGVGADGWAGLSPTSRDAVESADVLFGSERQLDAVPGTAARRIAWPTPMLPALTGLLDEHAGTRRCVLASGDPMFHGIGVTLTRLLGADAVRVLPHPSSASLACARLGWALHDVEVVSLVNRPIETVLPALTHRRRVLVLAENESTAAELATLLLSRDLGSSAMSVLEQLGGPRERVRALPVTDWLHARDVDSLNVVALEVRGHTVSRAPGLDDALYVGDGQLTKREVRALTLSALAPSPGERLWDVGGGSGSIAIEWMRTHPACSAIAFERVESRSATIRTNAVALGVPSLVVRGAAPDSLSGAPEPDAVFVGGGATQPGVMDACWDALPEGGRLVANAVTAESESLLLQWYSQHGGLLRRLQVHRGEPLGGFTGWRPQMPVTQWSVVKNEKETA